MTLNKLNRGKRACALFALCATTAMALYGQTFTTVHNFDGTNGGGPYSLVQATDGNLYGTAGVIFKIALNGTFTVLYHFCSVGGSECPDGYEPGELVQATDGDLYGTTFEGGNYGTLNCEGQGCGTFFKITPSGTLTTLYRFCALSECADGRLPGPVIQAADGDFYGVTGGSPTPPSAEVVRIFKMTPSGTLTNLYSFCNQPYCTAGGQLMQAANGDFYAPGVGGANEAGTVFKLTTSGTLTTLYSFCAQSGCPDGDSPEWALVQDTNGDFFGTTDDGGIGGEEDGFGTVFKITPSGTLTTLFRFCAEGFPCETNGYGPLGLIHATDGNFYGTTRNGGAYRQGTIFQITPGGAFTTLHSFCSQSRCTDGANPYFGLVQDTNGDFYGTTAFGGSYVGPYMGYGTIFRLSMGLAPFVETRPHHGNVGAAIDILGTDLTSAASVSFNGVPAAFHVASATEITATVPAGATSGNVEVRTPNGTLISGSPFRVP